MSPEEERTPLEPHLQAWVDERDNGGSAAIAPASREEAELLALLEAAVREPSREMSAEKRVAILTKIRAESPRQGTMASLRNAGLGLAAALFGLTLGLAMRPRLQPVPEKDPVAASVRVIKQVSFESIHEGKIVQFQLELSRVR